MNIDFTTLSREIEQAAQQAFTEIIEAHAGETIYSFALYSDEGAMTVCPSANSLEYLPAKEHPDFAYYQFEPAEWKYEMQGADEQFNHISAQLRKVVLDNEESNHGDFTVFQQRLYETCTGVLEKLKQEHFFTSKAGRDIFLLFTVSDYDWNKETLDAIVKRLNDNVYRDQYLAWMQTWS